MLNAPERIIQNRLSAIRWRMWLAGLFQHLARYGFWGLLLLGVLLIINRFFPLPIPIALPLIIALLVAVGLSLLRQIDLLEVGLLMDGRLNLKERLSTALETIRRRATDDFALLQVRDAARVVEEIAPATALPYTLPSILKWLPLPMLLIGFSFFIPRLYEIPPPPTPAERAAIDEAAIRLEREMKTLDEAALTRQIQDTVDALRNQRTDARKAQKQLSELRDEVNAQKRQTDGKEMEQATQAIANLSEASELFSGADAGEIASELQKIAAQLSGLTAAQKAELDALLRKLAQQLAGNPAAKSLTDRLNGIETQGLSPEQLRRIAEALQELNQRQQDVAQLEDILDTIQASRKSIGLAGLDMARKTGGIANSSGGPGNESDTGEAQGTQATGESNFEPQPTTDQVETAIQKTETPTRSLEAQTTELKLTGIASDSQVFSSAASGEKPDGENEPAYLPYSEVYLSAKQGYAEAITNDRIPVQYRRQISTYLEAIRPER